MKARYTPPKLTKQESHAVYTEAANDAARSIMAAVMYMLHMRGWHKDRMQKFYNDTLSVINMPEIFGHKLDDLEVREMVEKKYGIDFSRLRLNVVVDSETKKSKIPVIIHRNTQGERITNGKSD